MASPTEYLITLFHGTEHIGEFTMTCLPYPGLVLVFHPGVWRIDSVQIHVPQPGSDALRDGDPWLVDVRVTPTLGIHT